MAKWVNYKTEKANFSVIVQLKIGNTKYLSAIMRCLIFTAQQILALRGHKETRIDISAMSDFNRGIF